MIIIHRLRMIIVYRLRMIIVYRLRMIITTTWSLTTILTILRER